MSDKKTIKEIIIRKLKSSTDRLLLEIFVLFLVVISTVAVQIKYSLIADPEQPEPVTQFSEGNFGEILDVQLKRAGVEAKSRAALEYAVSKKVNVRKLRQNDRFEFVTGPEQQIVVFLLETADRRFLFTPDEEKYKSEEIKVKVEKNSRIFKGTIKDSLWGSMSEAGLPPVVIMRFADIFRWTVDFLTDTREGDFWAAEIEETAADTGSVLEYRIMALLYNGRAAGRNAVAMYGGDYYDSSGKGVKNMFLRAPLVYSRISSHFSLKRMHPVKKVVRPHLGTDYAAPSGTPVSTVADGVVKYYGKKGQNGNMVVMKHAQGYETYYLHLSRFAKNMRAGKKLKQGELVGYVGNTGISTGPHLDFRIKLKGRALNFEKMKRVSSGSISGAAKKQVQELIGRLPENNQQ